jgi:hypothetical protein
MGKTKTWIYVEYKDGGCDFEKDGDLGLLLKEMWGFVFLIKIKTKIYNYS